MAAEPNVRAFQGSMFFVNHDAEHMNTKPHRRNVYNHVQSNYRRWRRQEDARALRASVKLPSRIRIEGVEEAKQKESKSTFACRREEVPSSANPNNSAGLNDAIEEAAIGSCASTLQSSLHESMAIIGQGNSDPFSAYAVRIGPEVNNVLTFYRDCVLPSVHNMRERKTVTAANAVRDWRDTVDGLEDPGSAYGFLARYALAATQNSPVMARLTVNYRLRSTRLLQKKIVEGQSLHRLQNCWHIYMLFGAEIVDRNLEAAYIHGNMLRHIFQEQARLGKLDYNMLMYSLYNDCSLTTMFLVRPVFDPEEWLPNIMTPLWDVASAYLPAFPETVSAIDPCIDDVILQEIFIARRKTMYVLCSGIAKEDTPESTIFFTWSLSRGFMHQGRLINHYLTSEEVYPDPPSLSIELQDHVYAQRYITLASMQLTRAVSLTTKALGIMVSDASMSIMTPLKDVLLRSERSTREPGWIKYKSARLWSLFIGAHAEQCSRDPSKKHEKYDDWFTREFGKQAAKMGLRSWEAVENVLHGFIYIPTLPPNGATWFGDIMEPSLHDNELPLG